MPPIVEVRHLFKRYSKSHVNALDDISFEVEEGQFFALLGPNGAGKTTLLSILTTTQLPTSGKATINGVDVTEHAAAIRRFVGIIFQQPSLDLSLTGEENIRLHAVLYRAYPFRPTFRLMPTAYRQQVRELASLLGLEADIFKPVRTYSGGMRRKLEIIRTLVHRPKIIFLDEPTTGLDPASRRDLWSYLDHERSRHRTTVVLTTHYLEEAEQADAICIINQGKVVSKGAPRHLRSALAREALVIDALDRPELLRELEGLGLRFQFTDQDVIHVFLGPFTPYQLVKRLRTPLTLLRTYTPTLEDVYLEVVRDQAESE